MAGDLWFDVKSRTPHGDPMNPITDDDVLRTYREINFMTHLMWNAPYRMVHGAFKELIPHIQRTIGREDWPDYYEDALQALNDHLPLMLEDRATQDGLRHIDLHLYHIPSAGSFVNLAASLRNALERTMDGEVPQFPVCFPFIEAQSDQQFPDQPSAILLASREIQAFSMHDLYDRTNLRGKTPAIRALRDAGVLRTRMNPSEPEAKGGQSNGYRCNSTGDGCDHYPDDPTCFCSLDSQNQCSAMSTC